MKKIIFLGFCVLPLSACGWWDGAFAPHSLSASPYGGYGHNTGYASNYNQARYAPAQNYRAPGFYDRRRPKGVVSLEGGVGADFIAGGKLIDGGKARMADNQIGNGLPPNELSMRDAFGRGTRYDVTATYPVNDNRYFTGTAYRTAHDGRTVNLRTQRGTPIVGRLSDYQAHGVEFGLRQYSASPRGYVHPFVEGRIGGAYVDDIAINNTAGRTAVFDSGWVPTGAALIGFEAPASNRFTVGMETGVRYQGRLGTIFQPPSRNVTGNARSTGSVVTVPLVLRGRYRF